MTNYFLDNPDILFLFGHVDLRAVARLTEDAFSHAGRFDFAPEDEEEAVRNYRAILETIGALASETIAPSAEETDRVGNRLNDDGTVTLAPGIEEAISRLGKADLMGMTLPYEHGGLNCPQTVYAMAIEIMSRADASVVNFFGLQGVGETIAAYAREPIKRKYLPSLASGRMTGAMVLTEPDAGSDLQSVKTRADMDEKGVWRLSGVKRFITNGCGDVLLVLARSEPGTADGRGLSLFLVERGPRVRVRRLEEKLGIHGSPTCELVFEEAPGELVGERGRGLTAYVAPLMDAARLGIAAQSLGIAEAAFRVARDFARRRKQFGGRIDEIPAVRELLVDMSLDIQAARALAYYTSVSVDLEAGFSRALGRSRDDAAEAARLKTEARRYARYKDLLVPAAKYFASEMSVRVANSAVAVLGGSGYMRDYAVERHLRDSRITTIYEGTTQIQVSAAMKPIAGGAAGAIVDDLLGGSWPERAPDLADAIREGRRLFDEALSIAASRPERDYTEIHARRIVDMALGLVTGALLARQAAADGARRAAAKRWIASNLHEARKLRDIVVSGDRSVVEEFDALAGGGDAGR
jgi:alkylation response protein AidB-like acyl-CoA dehydrogenase